MITTVGIEEGPNVVKVHNLLRSIHRKVDWSISNRLNSEDCMRNVTEECSRSKADLHKTFRDVQKASKFDDCLSDRSAMFKANSIIHRAVTVALRIRISKRNREFIMTVDMDGEAIVNQDSAITHSQNGSIADKADFVRGQ
jgi:hypothetical protein